jgi:uncharacterized SAM-binding protein YcdF (DUF218 family)
LKAAFAPRASRRRFLAALVLAASALLAFLLSDAPAAWLVVESPPRRVDAALVFAGDPGYERTYTAARLVRANEARLLILTGGEPGPGDSAASLRDRAIGWGVPPERIRMETISRSTRESLLAVAPILRQEDVRSLALVTSPFHQRRVYLAARKALPGIALVNRPASPSGWSPRRWWGTERSRRIVLGEYAKIAYYALQGWI